MCSTLLSLFCACFVKYVAGEGDVGFEGRVVADPTTPAAVCRPVGLGCHRGCGSSRGRFCSPKSRADVQMNGPCQHTHQQDVFFFSLICFLYFSVLFVHCFCIFKSGLNIVIFAFSFDQGFSFSPCSCHFLRLAQRGYIC